MTQYTSTAIQPGKIVLFGSGETAPAGRQAHEAIFRELSQPIRVAVLETPAGFQPNSAWVAGRLAEFIKQKLQNYHPQITVVPARRRGGPHNSDDHHIAAPIMSSNYVFAGPGSPTYAVNHLANTWTWYAVQARQRRGAALALASATAIAIAAHTLPVYEIFKVGADPHWQPGLDLLGPYGLELAIITHWNNQEGGANLDTSRCFMGVERLTRLEAMLPPTATLLGIDEHTAVLLDFSEMAAQVIGQGGVTVRHAGEETHFEHDDSFHLDVLGSARLPALGEGLPDEVIEAALAAEQPEEEKSIPPEVSALIEDREAARRARDWAQADAIRDELARRGYTIEDTPQGPEPRQAAPA
jgi:cyanophycinase-like exopeptidase